MSDLTREKPEPFVFDWQAEPEGFLKWFIPTVLAGCKDAYMGVLVERTSKWTDVRVQVLINGVEVNAEHFLKGVERNMESGALEGARAMLDEVGGLDALEARIAEIRNHLIAQVENALRERGIELPDREEW